MARLNDLATARETLGFGTELLRARAGFHLAYARNLERARLGTARGDAWERIASPAEPWRVDAMIASSYRSAAQYAALFDTRLSVQLTLRASRAYLDAGAAFGLFLAASVLSDQALLHGGRDDLRALSSPLPSEQVGPTATHPVQQTYLLLTVAARPTLRQVYRGEPPGALLERLAAYDLQPIGPQAVPLAAYLDIASLVLQYPDASGTDYPLPGRIADEMASRLATIGRAQADALRANRRNHYLWENAIAPVNVVDLEQVALFGLAVGQGPRRSGQVLSQVAGLLEDDELAQLPSLAVAETVQVMPSMAEEAADIFRGGDREPRRDFRDGRSPRFGDQDDA